MHRRRQRGWSVRPQWFSALVVIGALAACADKTDADYRSDVVAAMHDSIIYDLDAMIDAGGKLQAAAPNRAWDPTMDAKSISAMQDRWKDMRRAWEHIEGAIGGLFPEVDEQLDGRYETLLGDGDDNLFDGTRVIGMHAIERILYSTAIRDEVRSFESALPGYKEAAYPATDDEAVAFKTELVQLLIDDTIALRKKWQPAAIDIGTAYQGLAGLMSEQREKVELAVTGEEESRYANITLLDLRSNLEGTQKVYNLFRDWIHSKISGPSSDTTLREKFLELETLYSSTNDDALPAAPVDWRPEAPTPANLATPFGTLWKSVREQGDPHNSGSVVYEMNQIATLLDLPTFVEP
jgi:iron uptake system component EfeO